MRRVPQSWLSTSSPPEVIIDSASEIAALRRSSGAVGSTISIRS
jgi:hypothetical protein